MFEKAAVKVFFGGLPPASLKESINAFERAQAITSGQLILNNLELAKAYKRDGQKEKAISLLKIMMTLPIHTEDDPMLKAEGEKLLREWQ